MSLIVLVATFSIWAPAAFPTTQMATNLLLNASVLLVVAVGTTFVLTAGGFDLSVRSVLVFLGVAAAKSIGSLSGAIGPVPAIVVAMAAGAARVGFVCPRGGIGGFDVKHFLADLRDEPSESPPPYRLVEAPVDADGVIVETDNRIAKRFQRFPTYRCRS